MLGHIEREIHAEQVTEHVNVLQQPRSEVVRLVWPHITGRHRAQAPQQRSSRHTTLTCREDKGRGVGQRRRGWNALHAANTMPAGGCPLQQLQPRQRRPLHGTIGGLC
jgi:hypothetical protein